MGFVFSDGLGFFFCDRIKVELDLEIGDDATSLFRNDNALFLSIDDNVLSFVMGNIASHFFDRHSAITPGL